MRGSIRTRYKGSWNIIIDLGYQPDPQTGQLKRIYSATTPRRPSRPRPSPNITRCSVRR